MVNIKGSRTEENLKVAFAEEAQAHQRYLDFANRADIEGQTDAATLFRSTAAGETGHALGHLEYLQADPATGMPIGSTRKNLQSVIEVNTISPTGYPMRMLKNSPAIGSGIRPNCESYGYILDAGGKCAYFDAYTKEVEFHKSIKNISVKSKTCLCTHMRNYNLWTCGHYTYRLKDTTRQLPDGSYMQLSTEHIFRDYQYSTDHKILLPDA